MALNLGILHAQERGQYASDPHGYCRSAGSSSSGTAPQQGESGTAPHAHGLQQQQPLPSGVTAWGPPTPRSPRGAAAATGGGGGGSGGSGARAGPLVGGASNAARGLRRASMSDLPPNASALAADSLRRGGGGGGGGGQEGHAASPLAQPHDHSLTAHRHADAEEGGGGGVHDGLANAAAGHTAGHGLHAMHAAVHAVNAAQTLAGVHTSHTSHTPHTCNSPRTTMSGADPSHQPGPPSSMTAPSSPRSSPRGASALSRPASISAAAAGSSGVAVASRSPVRAAAPFILNPDQISKVAPTTPLPPEVMQQIQLQAQGYGLLPGQTPSWVNCQPEGVWRQLPQPLGVQLRALQSLAGEVGDEELSTAEVVQQVILPQTMVSRWV